MRDTRGVWWPLLHAGSACVHLSRPPCLPSSSTRAPLPARLPAHLMRRLPFFPGCLVTGMPSPATTFSVCGETTSCTGMDSGRPSSVCSCTTVPHSASASDSLQGPEMGVQ